MVPSWTLRRGLFVGPRSKLSCPICHKSGRDRHWNADPVNKPWKISCRNCGAVFPKNDFRAFYQSALVDGVFDPAKGDPKYLVNVVDDPKAPGYDPTFGARPLKRLIQQKLENGLAGRIIDRQIIDGDHVLTDAEGKTFTFEVERQDRA